MLPRQQIFKQTNKQTKQRRKR